MIICDNCGRENEDEYKFCLGCGSALSKPEPEPEGGDQPEMIDCPHCSTRVPSNFKFCGACGGPIQAEQEPATQQAANPAAAQAAQKAPAQASEQAVQQAARPAAQQPQAPDPRERNTTPAGKPKPDGPTAQSSEPAAQKLVGRLIVIRPDGSEGAEIGLASKEETLGRDSEHKVLANDPFLSPEHATFTHTGDGFQVRDEGSLNGIFVRIRQPIELEHGDLIRLGQELLRYEELSELDAVVDSTEEETEVAGSPDEPYWGRLSLVAGPDRISRAFALGDEAVTIGRESGDILFRDDGFVSGKHARISRREGQPILEDLGSSNGTYRRVRQKTHLQDGELILMGQQLFRLAVV